MLFITLEGGEKSGKSTQAKLLCNYLKEKNYPVVLTKEPGATSLGNKLKKLLLQDEIRLTPWAELFLFLSDRAQHIEEVIKPALKAGNIVICDRFFDSSVVYQGWGRKIGATKVKLIQNLFLGELKPHLTLFFKGNFRVKRKTKDKIEREKSSFFKDIIEGYLKEAESDPERIKIIEVKSKSQARIKEEIINYINPLLVLWEEKKLKRISIS